MDSDDEGPPLLIDTRDLSPTEKSVEPPTPVTIVTGYLGSGKSTLLKYITSYNQNRKIAVVLNEFGQTSDIERSLMVRNSNEQGLEVEQWVELDNGCMCCTAKDAGVSAIEKLMDRQGRFDHVIIETSGLADPAPIANMFWLDDALMARVKLDGVVTVVDAKTIMRSLDDGMLASLQIACSDVVLINKCDAATAEEIESVQARVRDINGAARQIKCQFGGVPAEQVLDLDAYSCFGSSIPSHILSSVENSEHAHSKNHDLSTIVVPLNPQQFLDETGLQKFEAKLQHLLWTKELDKQKLEIHRTKGKIQCGEGTEHRSTRIVQGVRETYDITTVDYEPDGECKLVLIGKNLYDKKKSIIELFT